MKKNISLSIIISITSHIIILSILAIIRIYNDESIRDKISVSLIKEKKLTHIQRPLPSRPLLSVSKSHKDKILEQRSFIISQKEHKEPQINKSGISVTRVEPIKQINPELRIPILSVKPNERFKYGILANSHKDIPLREINIKPRTTDGYNIFSDALKLPVYKPKLVMVDDVMKEYINSIRKKIELKKRYPIVARDMGIEGRVRIKLVITKDGSLEKVEILETSGHEILDETALRSIRDAAPFLPIPEELKKNKLELSIYLTFEISK